MLPREFEWFGPQTLHVLLIIAARPKLPPTCREICAAIRIGNKSQYYVHHVLQMLLRHGLIKKTLAPTGKGKKRGYAASCTIESFYKREG